MAVNLLVWVSQPPKNCPLLLLQKASSFYKETLNVVSRSRRTSFFRIVKARKKMVFVCFRNMSGSKKYYETGPKQNCHPKKGDCPQVSISQPFLLCFASALSQSEARYESCLVETRIKVVH